MIVSKFTHNFATLLFGATMQVTLALVLVICGASAAFAQGKGYVANFISNDVSIVDPATNTVVGTVPVGASPEFLAVTPNDDFVYVTNVSSGNVSVISAA